MNRYLLARLVEALETVDTRKRLQKTVYLLQAAGCPFDADYILHRFGPYSQDVAQATDALVQAGILQETARLNGAGQQFSYALTDQGREKVREVGSAAGTPRATLDEHGELLEQLRTAPLWTLEVASTIAYFRKLGHSWGEAVENGCGYKGVDPKSSFAKEATELCRSAVGRDGDA